MKLGRKIGYMFDLDRENRAQFSFSYLEIHMPKIWNQEVAI